MADQDLGRACWVIGAAAAFTGQWLLVVAMVGTIVAMMLALRDRQKP